MSDQLPDQIPLFPLPNVVLFPGVALPLHIFEPRYRSMVRETLETSHRMIGMTLLRGDWRDHYEGYPEIFAIGCAGRVVSSEPLPDGRYNIMLHGMREFVITGEVRDRDYRQGTVEWRVSDKGSLNGEVRSQLRTLIERLTAGQQSEAALKLFEDPSVSDELMVNVFCFALEFSALEKQGLLEAGSLAERAARLSDVAEFALSARGSSSTDPSENRH